MARRSLHSSHGLCQASDRIVADSAEFTRVKAVEQGEEGSTRVCHCERGQTMQDPISAGQ
jgi:hypothetical protein